MSEARLMPRVLGKSGIEVSSIGMGCMGLTHASGDPLDDSEAVHVIREAHEMGYTFFDTAECYTGIRADGSVARNEDMVGMALASIRDQVVIATKFGVQHGGDRLLLDSSPTTVRNAVEGSLRRLRTDYIDLYYQHRIDSKVEPEEVAGVMADLIREGKIRAWGISETTEEYLRRADAVCPVAAIQNRYSLAARWHETIWPACDELDVAYVAFSPLANGLTSGVYNAATTFEGAQDFRTIMPQYTVAGQAAAAPLLALLRELADVHDATSAQVSLAWMLAKNPRVIPIPGSRKPERLRENLDSATLELSGEELARIEELLDQTAIPVFGGHSAS